MNKSNIKKCSGLTMIEVLVAIVILSIGLLGIAALQVVGIQNTNSANLRSQATILAYQFGDVLRTNKTEVDAGTFKDPDGDGSAGFISNSMGSVIANANCESNTGCTTTEMALNDLFRWVGDVRSLLPGGIARVTESSGIYTLTISWIDDKTDSDGTGVDVNGDGDSTDNIDTDGDGNNDANEVNFKQFFTSIQP